MKQKNNLKLILLLLVGVIAFSCAKERSPSLLITVVDESGAPAPNAIVHAWPGNNTYNGTVNNAEVDQTGTTDAAGFVQFNYKYSAVLDVDVIYYKSTQIIQYDTIVNTPPLPNTVVQHLVNLTDTLIGHKIVKIESVRQRSESNDYNETIIVK